MAKQPSPEQLQEFQPILDQARADLAKLSTEAFARSIEVIWNGRLRTTAGRVFRGKSIVELNPLLIDISLDEARRTLYHELAHLLVHYRYPKRCHRLQAHGHEWRLACAALGIPGEKATHALPFPKRTMRKHWSYTCPSCGKVIYRTRRQKVAYACAACCKRLNRGKFTKRFLFIEHQLDQP